MLRPYTQPQRDQLASALEVAFLGEILQEAAHRCPPHARANFWRGLREYAEVQRYLESEKERIK